jgi:hypothetical protein
VPEKRLKLRGADLDWRELEGELVALDLRESRYLAINRSGQVLWAALAESDGATRDELIDRLVREFDLEQARAAADVDAFTAELESRGLLSQDAEDA